MALRAFHANPCIGGFGGENTTPSLLRPNNRGSSSGNGGQSQRQGSLPRTGGNSGDAFCQIVKELVDNAVDAVNTSLQNNEPSEEWDKKKRIRVEIKPYTQHANERTNSSNDASPFDDESSDLLKIEVLDNGCGMDNIQNCVNAFHSTKANSQSQGSGGGEDGGHSNTSGRYGIGLTLCLLHAQRLVPNSYACITSTKRGMDHHSRALFVVESQNDAVVCHAEEQIPKKDLNTSGTSVALLIPGTSAHSLAWERLVAYFSRFRLCPNLAFGLEVLAPTLERIPIFIRPKPLKQLPSNQKGKTDDAKPAASVSQGNRRPQDDPLDISSWHELNADRDEGEDNHSNLDNKDDDSDSIPSVLFSKSEPRRMEVLDTAKEYWRDRKMALKNISVSNQRIRAEERQGTGSGATHDSSLELEVNMIVCPLPSRNTPDDAYEDFDSEEHSYSSQQHQHHSKEDEPAAIELVRMVNDVPILDGAEAHSCGLVHGLADKTVWGSFGLDISRKATHEPSCNAILPSTGCKWTPTFELQDDCRVGAFIQRDSNHKQLHSLVEDDWDAASVSEGEDFDDGKSQDSQARKRSALRQMDDLLPAGVRLHSILVVVRIRAAPSSLPLPTLSKGRLPLNHGPINDALHRGLNECLASLQRTNPLLLLSPHQLSSVVRDVRYIPKLAKELALSMCQTRNPVFRERARAILKMASATANGNACSQASFNSTSTASDQNLDPSHLSDATRKILSFKVQARLEALQEAKKREREEAKAAEVIGNMLDDEDLEEIGWGSGETASPAKNNPSQSSINDREGCLVRGQASGGLSTSSWKEVGEESSTSSDSSPEKVGSDTGAYPTAPLKAVNISMSHSGVPIEESDDNFDDDWM